MSKPLFPASGPFASTMNPVAQATDYDYTADDRAILDAEANAGGIDDFTFGGGGVVETTADELEAQQKAREFREVPLGDHLLEIVGFLKEPKLQRKEAYVNGRRISYSAYSVVAKFAMPDDLNAQVTDYFLLEPSDPQGLIAFTQGSAKPDGKTKGFMATKLYHFLERIGFHVVKGQRLPDAALRLGNWKGRQAWASIIPGDPYYDATEAREKPGRNQIKLFSYRPASSPPPSAIPAVGLASPSARPAMPPGLDSI